MKEPTYRAFNNMKQQVILLNSPSSSGKSTLAKALQDLLSKEMHENYAVVSIEDFMELSQTETIYEDDGFEISGDMCKKSLQLLEEGYDLLVDTHAKSVEENAKLILKEIL